MSSVVDAASALSKFAVSSERTKGSVKRKDSWKVEDHDEMPGPGAYDVNATAVGKRVAAVKFGSSKRFGKEITGSGQIGPGNYEPNRSFNTRKAPAVRIARPTAKSLAEHLMLFERQQVDQALGPGKYSPKFLATSEVAGVRSARIAPKPKPTLPLVKKQLEDAWVASAPDPGSYDPDFAAVKKRKPSATRWTRPTPANAAVAVDSDTNEVMMRHVPTPGPGAYDVNYDAVRSLAGQVRIAPENSMGALSQASTVSLFGVDLPGPGAYDPDDALLRPRPRAARIAPASSKSPFESDSDEEGDVLVLHPKYNVTRRSVSCSVVMREDSFISQASTHKAEPLDDVVLDPYKAYMSSSTCRRSRSAVIGQAPSCRGDTSGEGSCSPTGASLGPGRYTLKYSLVEPNVRVTGVLQSSTARYNPWFRGAAEEGNRLVSACAHELACAGAWDSLVSC